MRELGIVAAMRASSRQDRYSVSSRELRESCQVWNDLARSSYVKRTILVHEVALGVDVEEYQGALEHGRVPRFAPVVSGFRA